jgi:hypothetical protein
MAALASLRLEPVVASACSIIHLVRLKDWAIPEQPQVEDVIQAIAQDLGDGIGPWLVTMPTLPLSRTSSTR